MADNFDIVPLDESTPEIFNIAECTLIATSENFEEDKPYFELYGSPYGHQITYRVDAKGERKFIFQGLTDETGDKGTIMLKVVDIGGGINISIQRARNALPVINNKITDEEMEALAGRYNHAYFLFVCEDPCRSQYLVYLETLIQFVDNMPVTDEQGNYIYDKRLQIVKIINSSGEQLTLSGALGNSNVIVMKDPNGKNVYFDFTNSFCESCAVERATQIAAYPD